MLKAAVCDDNKIFLCEFEQILSKYPQIEKLNIFSDYSSLKKAIADGDNFDIIFMDIDFGEEKTGIDFASELYSVSPDSGIIYITCHRDRYAQQVFLEKTNLLGYLLKPIDLVLLERYLNIALRENEKRCFLSITVKGKGLHINCDRILWIESHNHTSTVCLENEKHIVYEKLRFLLERLPSHFAQCHKSYAVNMDKISILDSNSIFLANGVKIPVSRSFKKELNDKFFSFIGKSI